MKIILLLLTVSFCCAAADPFVFRWTGKGDQGGRDRVGIYVWFAPGLRPLPGTYRVSARLRSVKPGTQFTLQAVDATSGQVKWQGAAKPDGTYADCDFGRFKYDGSWPMRISDWNEPGFFIESVTLTPEQIPDPPEEKRSACDSADGWIALADTRIAVDPAIKKEGNASLKIAVAGSKKPWYDIGITRRLTVPRVKTVSFWLRFDGVPKPLWVQLSGEQTAAALRFRPEEFHLEPGKWKLIELPVSSFHFKPPRENLEALRAVTVSPECGADTVFLWIDDLLAE